jgi:hypothetical protein
VITLKKYDVQFRYIGTSSYLAFCHECNWTYQKHANHREGQREIRKHVSATGHTVNLEKNVVYLYKPIKPVVSTI